MEIQFFFLIKISLFTELSAACHVASIYIHRKKRETETV